VRPGSLINWTYRIDLPDAADTERDIRRLTRLANQTFPEAGWSDRSRTNAAPGLTRNIERFSQFLTLVGLTALVVGGVGVANAVGSFVDLKRPAIATLKCLGARGSLVFQIYLTQILILAGLGIGIGLVLGALMPFAAAAALADILPVAAGRIYPVELGLGALYGVLATLSFGLAPLGRVQRMPAASLFADRSVASPINAPLLYRFAQGLALLALAGLAFLLAGDAELALLYIGAVAAALSCCVWSPSGSCGRPGGLERSAARPSGSPSATSIARVRSPPAWCCRLVWA
jgi:putative ABC transport system permease protein